MQRKRTKKAKKKKNQNSQDGWQVQQNSRLMLPRTVTNIMPDRMMTRLTYKGMQTFTISAGTAGVAARWRPSSAFDIDPLLGSTSTVGFAEMSAFYNNYRVVKSMLSVKAAALSTAAISQIVALPLNADPTGAPTLAVMESWLNNPYSKIRLVPSQGGPVVSMRLAMTTEKIYGSKMVYFDDNFAALVNTSPVNNWYWAVAVVLSANAGGNFPVQVEIDISIDCEFYSRKALLN